MSCKDDRLGPANQMLATFAPDTTIRIGATGHVVITWTKFDGKQLERRWMTSGQDWYPVWHRRWGHGGTACTALAQLVRWIQCKPVYGISCWERWAGEECALLHRGDSAAAIAELLKAGYPQQTTCVLCGEAGNCGDWWSLDDVTGPCCSLRRGCRQNGGHLRGGK